MQAKEYIGESWKHGILIVGAILVLLPFYMMVYAMFEKGVKQNLVGIGSSLTIIFLLFVLVLTLTQVYFVNRRVHYS